MVAIQNAYMPNTFLVVIIRFHTKYDFLEK